MIAYALKEQGIKNNNFAELNFKSMNFKFVHNFQLYKFVDKG